MNRYMKRDFNVAENDHFVLPLEVSRLAGKHET